MDYDKLIEQLNAWNEQHLSVVCGGKHFACEYLCENEDCIVVRAATALETSWHENQALRGLIKGLDAELSHVRADLARVTAERDAIERDFRAFTKQWWEEANGFPCRFCKFENSGGCEQKAKHPDDEKPCAGRWFEWRGIKED